MCLPLRLGTSLLSVYVHVNTSLLSVHVHVNASLLCVNTSLLCVNTSLLYQRDEYKELFAYLKSSVCHCVLWGAYD